MDKDSARNSAAVRMIFFHLMQPVSTVTALYAYHDFMPNRINLIWMVCIREALYFLLIPLCAWHIPGVFLYMPLRDKSTVNKIMYISMPHHFLTLANLKNPNSDLAGLLTTLMMVICGCCDMAGVILMTGMLHHGTVWPALIVSLAIPVIPPIVCVIVMFACIPCGAFVLFIGMCCQDICKGDNGDSQSLAQSPTGTHASAN